MHDDVVLVIVFVVTLCFSLNSFIVSYFLRSGGCLCYVTSGLLSVSHATVFYGQLSLFIIWSFHILQTERSKLAGSAKSTQKRV